MSFEKKVLADLEAHGLMVKGEGEVEFYNGTLFGWGITRIKSIAIKARLDAITKDAMVPVAVRVNSFPKNGYSFGLYMVK